MIKRAKRKGNFTVVYNEFINDARLSARAKGVMIWLLSKPDDWVISREAMYKAFKEGRTAVWTAFKELIDLKYVICIENVERVSSGQFFKRDNGYVVYEVSIDSDLFDILYPDAAETARQTTSRQDSAFGRILKTDLENTELNKKQNTDLVLNTELLKSKDRFFDFCLSVGLETAATKTYEGIQEGEVVSIGILPPQLTDKLISMGCKITANKKLYIPK